MTDKQLQQSVIDELAWEPSVTSEHIGVTAREGVITLSGHVPSYWEKRAAQTAASRVKGVKAVVEEIEVKLFGGNIWADEKIAERALQNLASDGSVPKDRVKLTVEKGWVHLIGDVDWNYQKTAADFAVHRLTGVLGVMNEIKIKPHVQAYEVREKIEKALKRVAAFDAQPSGPGDIRSSPTISVHTRLCARSGPRIQTSMTTSPTRACSRAAAAMP
jgi:osmotically-inducible protein OsmY